MRQGLAMPALGIYLAVLAAGCTTTEPSFIEQRFADAQEQYVYLADEAAKTGRFPKTIDAAGNLAGTDEWDWTGGFFPGALWYIYHHTADTGIRDRAIRWTEALEKAKDLDMHHDIGFVMYCSYGNAIRFLDNAQKTEAYNATLVHSANTALKRFDPKVGLIKSWNEKKSWDGRTVWEYPVIIDNMMNLEMLCYVSDITGDPKFREAAISHADKTMANHFREDYSTYHVVDYDSTGNVVARQTNQGFADNSTWSRGQAWAIYGFTMMFRETGKPEYLKTAKEAAAFYMNHPNLPADKIPYWDFNAHQPGYTPDINIPDPGPDNIRRDASAAAIAALIELSTLTDGAESRQYLDFAKATLETLSGPEYFADRGTNAGFLLKHSVGSIPHGAEVDKPLVYADYYYLEGLTRLNKLD